jgi:ribosome-associated protein
MGRRKTTRFGWVRGEDEPSDDAVTEAEGEEGEEGDEDAPEGRVQGSIHRLRMDELGDLVLALSRLPPSARAALPVDDEAKAQLDLLASLGKTPARRRQFLRTRAFFRDADPAVLRALAAGHDPREEALQRAERWRTRLLQGGDDALDAFLAEHPAGERQPLRTAIREARGEGPAAKRASRRLFQAIRAAIEVTVEAAGED